MRFFSTQVGVVCGICCTVVFISCKPKIKQPFYYFDYEQAAGWNNIQLESGFAHSGTYCEKITPEKLYSHTFSISLAEVAPQPLKKVKAAVWLAAPDAEKEIWLVIDLFSAKENKSIVYKPGNNLTPLLKKAGGWQLCTNEMDISAIKDGSAILKVYVWNPDKQQVFADDFEIKFE